MKIHIQETSGSFLRERPRRPTWDRTKLQPLLREVQQGLGKLPYEVMLVAGVQPNGQMSDKLFFTNYSKDEVTVDRDKVVRMTRRAKPHGIIMVHNHPSCELLPSLHDLRTTEALDEVMAEEHIDMVDHVIVGPQADTTFSFARAKEAGTLASIQAGMQRIEELHQSRLDRLEAKAQAADLALRMKMFRQRMDEAIGRYEAALSRTH